MTKSEKSQIRQVVLTIQDENGNIISSFPTNLKKSDLQPEEPLTSYSQLQKIADNLENGLDNAVDLLTGPVISQLLDDQATSSPSSSNPKNKTVKKASTSMKSKKSPEDTVNRQSTTLRLKFWIFSNKGVVLNRKHEENMIKATLNLRHILSRRQFKI